MAAAWLSTRYSSLALQEVSHGVIQRPGRVQSGWMIGAIFWAPRLFCQLGSLHLHSSNPSRRYRLEQMGKRPISSPHDPTERHVAPNLSIVAEPQTCTVAVPPLAGPPG